MPDGIPQELFIDEIEPGYVLAGNVYDQNGNLLLSNQLVLNESHIGRLQKMKIRSVLVLPKKNSYTEKAQFDQLPDSDLSPESTALDNIRRSLRPLNTGTERAIAEELNKLWAEAKIASTISQKIVDELTRLAKTISTETRMRKNTAPFLTESENPFSTHTLHMLNGVILGSRLLDSLGRPQSESFELSLAFLLYDIGKAKIPVRILEKEDSLDESQIALVQRHSKASYELVINLDKLSEENEKSIFFHHENFDGSGYPSGLKSTEIPHLARMIRVLDSYVAMCSVRPYRSRIGYRQSLTNILMGHGRSFDPDVVKLFVEKVGFYPAGTIVRLSDGSLALVVSKASKDAPFSPVVKLFYKDKPVEETVIDLSTKHSNPRCLDISDEIF